VRRGLTANGPMKDEKRAPLVICIDDEPPVLEALKRTLRGEPYELVTTREPGRVLEWLDRRDVAVVIADQRMPETSGTELLEEVRRRSPTSRRVILTAFPESNVIRARAAEGIERLITKPWDGDGLRHAVRELIRGRTDDDAENIREFVLPVDCRGRSPEDILQEIEPALSRLDVVRRGLVIFLKNLTGLAHSLRGFVERLSIEVAHAGIRAYLVEPTGLTAVLLDPLEEIGPLIVFAPKRGEKGRRTLLVESRSTSADILAALLESAGHEVARASTAAQVVDFLRERVFDVVLLDLSLRRTVMRAVEQGLAKLERKPDVVGISTCPNLWDAESCGRFGVRTYVAKPYSVREILRAVSGLDRADRAGAQGPPAA
jgi:DNA-binding NtrC family response regulator